MYSKDRINNNIYRVGIYKKVVVIKNFLVFNKIIKNIAEEPLSLETREDLYSV